MEILIVEPLDPEVLDWLGGRHRVHFRPELADQPLRLRQALTHVQAAILPPSASVDTYTLQAAPLLRAIGRLSSGAENIDAEACVRCGIEIVRPQDASATAEAEFVVGALLQLLRRVPVLSADGLLVGRELGAATIGLIGMTTTAKALARLLKGFGARVIGYDPALHPSDISWRLHDIEHCALLDLFAQCDGVCVLLTYATRFRGLIGERYLQAAKENQVLVSIAPSSLFDDRALALALADGRLAGAWLDSLEPGTLDETRPLAQVRTLQTTPRVAGTTRESRQRSAWLVARRIDAILGGGFADTVSNAVRESEPATPWLGVDDDAQAPMGVAAAATERAAERMAESAQARVAASPSASVLKARVAGVRAVPGAAAAPG